MNVYLSRTLYRALTTPVPVPLDALRLILVLTLAMACLTFYWAL